MNLSGDLGAWAESLARSFVITMVPMEVEWPDALTPDYQPYTDRDYAIQYIPSEKKVDNFFKRQNNSTIHHSIMKRAFLLPE
ncbi:MAG: hypothetical protein M0Z84_13155 [Gammaproteobacteria bacterium]|nr:hypothetical protein [Gammaproteobacteria bacterium]